MDEGTATETNLERWKATALPGTWVKGHSNGWNHDDWSALMDTLRASDYWPMEEPAIAQHLERLRIQIGRGESETDGTSPGRVGGASKRAMTGSEMSSFSETAETGAILFESATPRLYALNGFRVLDLPSDATARDISRRKQTVEKALSHGLSVPPGSGRYLQMSPAPDQSAVREAMQRLSDPERRLIDEIFWFWAECGVDSANDKALARLREGKDKEAEGIWLEKEADDDDSSVSTHNLAILYHLRAVEGEVALLQAGQGVADSDGLTRIWDRCFRRWRALLEQEAFCSRLTARIRELEDPRLTSGTGRRIRAGIPAALLSICAQLVLEAVELGCSDSASRLVEVIGKSGFDQKDIDQGLRTAIEPVRSRIKALCKAAELASMNDPIHADQACRQLLSSSRKILSALDCLLPADHPTRQLARDDVAERALRCQVTFARKTENWSVATELLELTAPCAVSASVRKQLQENLDIVKKRADENDDFCADGYYEAPPDLINTLERIRVNADRREYDQAVASLDELLAGNGEVCVPPEFADIVSEALAYCLGCRAIGRWDEEISRWNEFKSTVIGAIQARAEEISSIAWMSAGLGKIPQYANCECMACGLVIYDRYSVLKWTFNEDKGPLSLIVCGMCGNRHKLQMDDARKSLNHGAIRCAQDFIDAANLDPANKFVAGQLERLRKNLRGLGIAIPCPKRKRGTKSNECAMPTSESLPQATDSTNVVPPTLTRGAAPVVNIDGAGRVSKVATQSRNLALLGLLLGVLTAIPAVFYSYKALAEIDRSDGKISGRRRAVAGLVIGYVVIAFWLVMLLTFLSGGYEWR